MADLPQDETKEVTVVDGAGVNELTVNVDGSLNVVLSGESSTPKIFSAVVPKTGIGTTELMSLYLKNPNASGKTVYLKSIIISGTHTVAGSWVRCRMYSNPTSSANGSAVTIRPLGVGSGNTTVATAFDTPTVSVNGGLLVDMTTLTGQTEQYNFPAGSYLSQNNNLLFTFVADGTNRVAQLTLIWTEL